MYKNGLSYVGSALMVLITHCAMLFVVFINGKYDDVSKVLVLAGAVIGLDMLYFIVMLFYKQMTYSIDFMLLLVLGMSIIFQSCFGGVELEKKQVMWSVICLFMCRMGYLLCRNHKWIAEKKKEIFAVNILIILSILTLTGGRSMWIQIGSFTVQPSEFLKSAFILACATSIVEQQRKTKILCFNTVKPNIALFALIGIICGLQWWCKDLGTLPTFVGIYGCGLIFRMCYPKAKFSKSRVIGLIMIGVTLAVVAFTFAPSYVQDRLHVNLWDKVGGEFVDAKGWQQRQAIIAMAGGGWFGKGPGHGVLHKVPAYTTDIVFQSISEEWGLFFALMIIVVILIMLAMPLINPCRSYFHATLTTGVCTAFIIQIGLNVFGSCGVIPFTGVTVPFISLGGSSMVTSGFMMGMMIAGQSPSFKPVPKKTKKKAVTA